MIGRQGKPDLPRAFMLTRANQRLSLVSFSVTLNQYIAQMLNQVLPILNWSFICLSSDSEEKFFVLPKEACSDCERLKVFKEVLVSSEALKPKLDRCLKVTSSLGDIQSAYFLLFVMNLLCSVNIHHHPLSYSLLPQFSPYSLFPSAHLRSPACSLPSSISPPGKW